MTTTRATSTALPIVALVAATFGAYLMAFGTSPAMVTPILALVGFFLINKQDDAKKFTKSETMLLTGIAIAIVALLLASTADGYTKESNQWFQDSPLRPYIGLATWLLFTFALYFRYRNDRAQPVC